MRYPPGLRCSNWINAAGHTVAAMGKATVGNMVIATVGDLVILPINAMVVLGVLLIRQATGPLSPIRASSSMSLGS
jgi:hypothetical protein